MGNCHPSKTNVNLGLVSVNIGFLGWQFTMLPSCPVNIYIILTRPCFQQVRYSQLSGIFYHNRDIQAQTGYENYPKWAMAIFRMFWITPNLSYTGIQVIIINESWWFHSKSSFILGVFSLNTWSPWRDDALGGFMLLFISHILFIYVYILNYRVYLVFNIVK